MTKDKRPMRDHYILRNSKLSQIAKAVQSNFESFF